MSARWVLPMTGPPVREGAVAVGGDGSVLGVGPRADVRAAFPGAPETRADGALLPGLVNAHAHLELSAVGMVPGGDGVVGWTRRLAARLAETPAAPAQVDAAALAAARAARAFGTAAVGDVGDGTAGWRALAGAGMGGLFFHELLGSRDARTGDALTDAAAERAAAGADGVPAVPAPHAPYSAGPGLLRRIFAAAAAAGQPTSIHVAEDRDEIALLAGGGGAWAPVLRAMRVDPATRAPGLRPVAYLEGLGAFAAKANGGAGPLLVHMVEADADDRRRARAGGATVVLCPRSNLHVVGRLPDVPALIADGVPLALGTDSLASVPDLSPWAEMAAAARAFPDVAPRVWLRAATVGGAAALGLARRGAIAVGRRPGLIDVAIASAGDGDPERCLVEDPQPHVRWSMAA